MRLTVDLSGVDLLGLIGRDIALERVASTNGGEYAGPCPLPGCGGGVDRFRVWPAHPNGRGRWWCRQCGRNGDAVDYLRERDGLDYRGALQVLGLEARQEARTGGKRRRRADPPPKPALTAPREADPPTWDTSAAVAVVDALERDLWAEVGEKARAWLAGRGIQEETARAWRLGYNLRKRSIAGLIVPRGIAIPCFVGGVPWYVKVRRPVPPLSGPKYQQVKGSKAAIFGLDHLNGKKTVAICEGELDAILLHQEAGDLVDVVALGSKTAKPALPFLAHLAGASRWLVALDQDADRAAKWWGEYSARVRRARPLQGNDLTDFHQAGGDLRAWVTYHLGRLEAEHGPQVGAQDLDAAGRPGNGKNPDFHGEAVQTSPSGAQGKPADLEARAEALLAELQAATGCDDARAEELLARWAVLEGELGA